MKLILAASSPRRKQILERIGFKFEIISPNIDESHLSVKIKPAQYCISLAKMKSMKISQYHPNALVKYNREWDGHRGYSTYYCKLCCNYIQHSKISKLK